MRHIVALVDLIQAGDCSELADQPVNIVAGKTIATQLVVYPRTQDLESSTCGEEIEESLSQPSERSAHIRFVGRVHRGRFSFSAPTESHPMGTSRLDVLAVANGVPLLLCYCSDGEENLRIPEKDDLIRAEGNLYCEPGFAYGHFFSPVMADIAESKLLPRDMTANEERDWGVVRLHLRTDISEFDIVGDNLKEDCVFVRVSDYNPPYTLWQDYLKRVHGRRWRKVWKKSVEGV